MNEKNILQKKKVFSGGLKITYLDSWYFIWETVFFSPVELLSQS